MKKVYCLFIITLISYTSFGQSEIKTDLVNTLFDSYSLSSEHGIKNRFSLEPMFRYFDANKNISVNTTGFSGRLLTKYYFIQGKKPLTGAYALAYLYGEKGKVKELSFHNDFLSQKFFGYGFGFGGKLFIAEHIIFDPSIGFGRMLYNQGKTDAGTFIDLRTIVEHKYSGFVRFGIGYRINNGTTKKEKKGKGFRKF
jgi:hypothetical protein